MELSIDKFGRFVLPKRLRDHLGVQLGLKVEVVETAEGLLFKPSRPTSALVRKNGILVHQGQPNPASPPSRIPSGIPWSTLVEDDREERIRQIVQP
jgi:bifunctional DNA-binding transcriptional regulator/antitoxin component of YhaV-PrlF toxin-antitoxin module